MEQGMRMKIKSDACKAKLRIFFSKRTKQSSLSGKILQEGSTGWKFTIHLGITNETCGKSIEYLAGGQSTRHAH